jgi:hypothetical protein
MSLLDFINELRKGEPDLKKAVKAMKILGWICFFAAIWNFVIPYLAPFDENLLPIPEYYPFVALVSFMLMGYLFFLSARGIEKKEHWGKKLAQFSIVLLIVLFVGFMVSMTPLKDFMFKKEEDSLIPILFSSVSLALFGILAYFGVRYLGRLPVKESGYIRDSQMFENISNLAKEEVIADRTTNEMIYKDSFFPFGVFGTFAILFAVAMLILFVAERYVDPELMSVIFTVFFLFIFLGPTAYNYIASPFQNDRDLMASFTGGGSIYFFSGSWPFFRLLIYNDGLEVRVMFHRFFIPYDKMDAPPKKARFFFWGLLIRSDLPGVPSRIRFYPFRAKKVVEAVNERYRQYLADSSITS